MTLDAAQSLPILVGRNVLSLAFGALAVYVVLGTLVEFRFRHRSLGNHRGQPHPAAEWARFPTEALWLVQGASVVGLHLLAVRGRSRWSTQRRWITGRPWPGLASWDADPARLA